MLGFEHIIGEIYRLCVPFDKIYTGVFAVKTEMGLVLVDTATTAEDAREYIIPALQKAEFCPRWIVITHHHGDHIGGLKTLLREYPEAIPAMAETSPVLQEYGGSVLPLKDNDLIAGDLRVCSLPGHSIDAIGLLDRRDRTLLSGDSLQLYGVDRFGTAVGDIEGYIRSIARLQGEWIENIIASHDYAPHGYMAKGEAAVRAYLNDCIGYISRLREFANGHVTLDPETVTRLYCDANSTLPPVWSGTFESLLTLIRQGN